jgi:hypothetical protein
MTAQDLSVWVTAAATIATAVATVILAIVTWLLFKATRQMAVANDPYIVATLEPNRWSFIHVDLLIENTGSGPAFEIQIEFDPPLIRDRHSQKTTMPPTQVTVIRPSQTLRNYLGNGSDILDNRYSVSISWKKDPRSKTRITNKYNLDLQHYKDFIQLGGGDPQVQISQDIKKIRERFDSVVQGLKRISVDIHTDGNRRQEQEQQEKWHTQANEEINE